MTSWDLYWLSRLDDLKCFFLVLSLVGTFGLVKWIIISLDIGRIKSSHWFFVPLLNALLFGSLAALTPSTKEAAAIVVLPKILNSEKVQAMPEKIIDLATAWLDDLRPKKP